MTSVPFTLGRCENDGSSLMFQHSPVFGFTADRLLSRDRITIIDCGGTVRILCFLRRANCGSSSLPSYGFVAMKGAYLR